MQSYYDSVGKIQDYGVFQNTPGYGDELKNTAIYNTLEAKHKSLLCPPTNTPTSGYGVLEHIPSHDILESEYGSLPVSEDLYAEPKEVMNSIKIQSPPPGYEK